MWNIRHHVQPNERLLYDGTPSWWMYIKYTLFFWLLIPLLIASCKKFSTRYAITDKRIIHRIGVFSEEIKTSHFNYITSVNLKQSFIGKILGYGDIIIDSAGTGTDVEFVWKYVPFPENALKLLERYIY